MIKVALIILFFVNFVVPQYLGDEAIYTVNGKKALHSVNENFLSFSIDPAVLLTSFNLSEISMQLAQHLSPAFIRIAGPSTQYVKYEDFEDKSSENVVVTPSIWFGINEWLTSANLTPIFGINDRQTTNEGVWNPQSIMPLLELSDNFNLTCYWQLGYDCINKTEMQYKEDLKRFHHILDAFPEHKEKWKIVGSDYSRCLSTHFETSKRLLDQLENIITAVTWEPYNNDDNFLNRINNFPIKPKVPIWITTPKSTHSPSFASAIVWAKQMGEAAKLGYNAIFRQPRLHEMFSPTPPYWVSVLHKTLMGSHVLDLKSTTNHPEMSVYAHCTRHQNNFIRSGAMTVFMINNGTTNHTILLRFGTALMKNTEVQSYILTSSNEDATDVYLNGEKLTLAVFSGDKMNIQPKHRRAKIMNYLSLSLPPKSIGFFVLPAARMPVCINEEVEMKLLMQEIGEDQNISFSQEISIASRFNHHKIPTLRELQDMMAKELASDEKYYNQAKNRNIKLHKTTPSKKVGDEKDARKFFIERAKMSEKQRKQLDDGRKNVVQHILSREKPKENEDVKRILELELTSGEIRKILSDRAKAKAAKKNIIFTSQELEEIMEKATEKFLKNKNTAIIIRKKEKRDTSNPILKDINMRLLKLKSAGNKRAPLKRQGKIFKNRQKRDINMELLKVKTAELLPNRNKKIIKNKFQNRKEKTVNARESADDSTQLSDYVEDDKKKSSLLPDEDIYAELANSEDLESSTTAPTKNKFILKPKTKPKPTLPKFGSPKLPINKKHETKPKENLFLSEEDYEEEDYQDEEANFGYIHEFYMPKIEKINGTKQTAELWEIGFDTEPIEETKDNHLPVLINRGLDVKENVDFEMKNEDWTLENDYANLESEEEGSLRLKRQLPNLIKADDENFYFIISKGYDPAKVKIDENLKDHQFKLLKNRLVQRKKLDFLNKNTKFLEKRNVEDFAKRYKSLTEGLKMWQPSDIVTLNKQKNQMKKAKRSADNYVNSVENEIDNFMNEIAKDSTIIQPHHEIGEENGSYQLVFPNQDKIQVAENHGETELKFLMHGNNEIPKETCPPNEKTSTESNIQKIAKKPVVDTVWDKVFHKLSSFFHGLSVKLKDYILNNLLK